MIVHITVIKAKPDLPSHGVASSSLEKETWNTKSGPLQECKLVVAISPPSTSAKSKPLTYKS